MRQTWLKRYATSGKPKTVTNLGLKAFINRLIQSYKDDPSWENPYEPIMEMEIGDFVQRLYPTMPSNRENKLPARRKRVLPVKEEPEEDAPLPIAGPLPIPVRAIKREETEEERASKRRRLDSLARRGASPASPFTYSSSIYKGEVRFVKEEEGRVVLFNNNERAFNNNNNDNKRPRRGKC